MYGNGFWGRGWREQIGGDGISLGALGLYGEMGKARCVWLGGREL